MRHFIIAVTLLLSLPVTAPLDVLAAARLQSCATAPCCVMKNGTCPMHHNATKNSCRIRSCVPHDGSLADAPPVVGGFVATVQRLDRVIAICESRIASFDRSSAPRDPPPPRLA